MSYRTPPSSPPPKPPAVSPKAADSGNALWRIGEFFPNLPAELQLTFKNYQIELLKFNSKVNLISRNTERESDELHFADCILACQLILAQDLGAKVYDIGSGNGFPGLIMPILDRKREFFMVESDARKCEFIKHAIHVLGLKNVSVLNMRFENLSGMGVDVAVSRGFASISKTLLACNRVFSVGVRFFHLKGNNWSSEIAELPSQLISVWKPHLLGEYTLPVSQARRAVVITQKTR